MAAVLGDDGPDGGHIADLMTPRLRVVAVQQPLAMAADWRIAGVDGVGEIDEGAFGLGLPVLAARFVAGRRLGWRAFEGRRSDEGGLEELVEFWLRRCWISLTCFCRFCNRLSYCWTGAKIAACAASSRLAERIVRARRG